jgi:hypothetical protein
VIAVTDTHTWVKNRDTGQFWQCPNGVLAVYAQLGWEPTDERPVEPDAAVDERRAWEAEQARLAAEEAADEKAAKPKSTSTKAAARGESQES